MFFARVQAALGSLTEQVEQEKAALTRVVQEVADLIKFRENMDGKVKPSIFRNVKALTTQLAQVQGAIEAVRGGDHDVTLDALNQQVGDLTAQIEALKQQVDDAHAAADGDSE